MRSDTRRLLGTILLLPLMAWVVRRFASRQMPASAASRRRPGPPGDPVTQFSDTRGYQGVALVFGSAAVLVLVGLVWRGIDQRLETRAQAMVLTRGNPAHAPVLMRRFGCGGCHTIPGVAGADGKVGPALGDLRARVYIGGHLPNTADNLIGWIVDPPRYAPHSAMPATGIDEAQARDVAAYLYTR